MAQSKFPPLEHPRIFAIPAFSDNYIWAILNPAGDKAYIVDPGDGEAVKNALTDRGLQLAGILITHHHFDHVGGVETLTQWQDCPVYGPNNPNIKSIEHILKDEDEISIDGFDLNFTIREVPGHTLDHIAYHGLVDEIPVTFCGDTLFAGGCGRIFEGTPVQMQDSLDILADLPEETLVYCAHEYTQSNLAFALAVEPNNSDLQTRVDEVASLREQDLATVPTKIAFEIATNPFLRTRETSVIEMAQQTTGEQVESGTGTLAAIRAWKDNF